MHPHGHVPGFHTPGGLAPPGAVYAQHQAAQDQQRMLLMQHAEMERRTRANLLILLCVN
jgi:hypothetical protein